MPSFLRHQDICFTKFDFWGIVSPWPQETFLFLSPLAWDSSAGNEPGIPFSIQCTCTCDALEDGLQRINYILNRKPDNGTQNCCKISVGYIITSIAVLAMQVRKRDDKRLWWNFCSVLLGYQYTELSSILENGMALILLLCFEQPIKCSLPNLVHSIFCF